MGPHYKTVNNKTVFPIIKDRLTTKIKLTPNFTALVTAHGKTEAYLHRFKKQNLQNALATAGTKLWTTYSTNAPNCRGRE
jgi:hypothetical protein